MNKPSVVEIAIVAIVIVTVTIIIAGACNDVRHPVEQPAAVTWTEIQPPRAGLRCWRMYNCCGAVYCEDIKE